MRRCLIIFVLPTLIVAGLTAADVPFDEAAFRKAVQDGLPPEPKDRAIFFARGHESIAIPILVAEIRARVKDRPDEPETGPFILRASDLAIEEANQRSVDVVADLVQVDPKRFSRLVAQVLYRGLRYKREYELAYYAMEHYPGLGVLVTDWLKDSLNDRTMDESLAREILKRERAGHPYSADDPLLSRVSVETRENIEHVVQRLRFEPH